PVIGARRASFAARAAPVMLLLPSLPSPRPSALPIEGGNLFEALAMCPFSLLPMSRPFAASSRAFHLSTPRFFQRWTSVLFLRMIVYCCSSDSTLFQAQ